MKNRFTHTSKFGRHSISAKDRAEVYERDNYTCQYCLIQFGVEKLSIDHLIPVALNGLHEIRNYVTCCRSCNSRKRHTKLDEFAKKININVEGLPVHGDPIIDNEGIPVEIRMIRKRIFDKMRLGESAFTGKAAQQKIEKKYRMEVWDSSQGKKLIASYPELPGQVRIMIPEIETIANSKEDFILLIELAKSASTRNLIGTTLTANLNTYETVLALLNKSKDVAMKKRLKQAMDRANSVLRRAQD